MPPADYTPADKKEDGIGPFVGIVIIVGLLLAGGIYFFVTWESAHQVVPDTTGTQDRADLGTATGAQANLQ